VSDTIEHVALMGLELAKLTETETTRFVLDALDDGYGGWICPVNLDVLRQVVHSEELRALVGSADLVVADGMPLLWASRLQGTPLPERVAGSSLILTLSAALARNNRSVYLLGGNHGAAQAAGAQLQDTLPGFRLAGWSCPPFGFEHSTEQLAHIMRNVEEAKPDVVFVGLGFPKQDRLIAQLRERLPGVWFMSCGISFSFLIGEVRRAPPILQTLGLEWTHRLVQEPSRLAKRYLVQGLPFAARLTASSACRRRADLGSTPPAKAER
jgi:N-acetylglucosaminyldiphosphoundecaprenol N-acetyl-beta-D-mannosaminyltransferase